MDIKVLYNKDENGGNRLKKGMILMSTNKKLYKKSSDKKLCGVCSGLADYFNTDKSLVRLLFVLVAFMTAVLPCLVLYIVVAIVLPDESEINPPYDGDSQGPTYTE